ncbi:MAG: hypothetical protein JWN86_1656 [Planctomycetota bacterium]|nr:hypothetical protein [Planctomycetota bacterium]
MNVTEVMNELKTRGTAQARKTYLRHGADADLFGVSYADLKLLKKAIKVDQPLAEALWSTGNYDARIFAAMIADPKTISAKCLTNWVKTATNYPIADAVAGVAAQSPAGVDLMTRWTASKNEWIASSGWSLLAGLAIHATDQDDSLFSARITTIESTIHASKNRVRHTMNGALISIGIYKPGLRDQALAAASRIGKVLVDHGDTSCKTPEAVPYIQKALARKA